MALGLWPAERTEYILLMDFSQKWELGGDSRFEGGADQRLHAACLLGQTTNSHITLAAAPSLNRVHLENTETSVLAREVCSFAFNTFTTPPPPPLFSYNEAEPLNFTLAHKRAYTYIHVSTHTDGHTMYRQRNTHADLC